MTTTLPSMALARSRARSLLGPSRIALISLLLSLTWLHSPAGAQEPVVTRGPYLQGLLPQRAQVVWAVRDEAGLRRVDLWEDGSEDFRSTPADVLFCRSLDPLERCYRARFVDLKPSTSYRYAIFSGDVRLTPAGGFPFRTPPERGGGVVQVAVLGDSGTGSQAQKAVSDVLETRSLHGVLHTGDVDYNNDFSETIFGPYSGWLPRWPLVPAVGNHDIQPGKPFLEEIFFPPGVEDRSTFFSFEWGPAHFVVLDTTLIHDGSNWTQQVEWLCSDLTRARSRDDIAWLIVVQHEPIFTTGPHSGASGYLENRHTLAPIFDAFEVDIVFSGDDHNYQRSHPVRLTETRSCLDEAPLECEASNDPTSCYEVPLRDAGSHYGANGGESFSGTIYVVTGGGGQLLYEVDAGLDVDRDFFHVGVKQWHFVELEISPARLEARAIDLTGEEIDRFSISKMRHLRGDVNFDGTVDMGDAIGVLSALFLGETVDCLAAGNVDAGGAVDIADAVWILTHLFLGGDPPRPPYPQCGPISEGTEHDCERNGC